MAEMQNRRFNNFYNDLDEYFMAIVFLSKKLTNCNYQVGTCIVDSNKRIIGIGYNDCYHAEANAITNRTLDDLQECTIYTTLFPCHTCAKKIIDSGIKSVVYAKVNNQKFEFIAKMFKDAGVTIRQFKPTKPDIHITFT